MVCATCLESMWDGASEVSTDDFKKLFVILFLNH